MEKSLGSKAEQLDASQGLFPQGKRAFVVVVFKKCSFIYEYWVSKEQNRMRVNIYCAFEKLL